MFPNQDFHSGKGLGNLIALPLFKKTLKQGNSCFINIDNAIPFADQWEYLKSIRKISSIELDKLYQTVSNTFIKSNHFDKSKRIEPKKLTIELNNVVSITRYGLPLTLINFLKEELNFVNTEFLIKKKIGKNTFGTERYFKFIEESEDYIIIPRGCIGKLIRFCKENKIEYEFIDKREKKVAVNLLFNAQLKEHQQLAIDSVSKKDFGVIVAPPGSGKTVVALKVIAEKKQPALIITHRKQIAEQWIERIQTFLGYHRRFTCNLWKSKSKVPNFNQNKIAGTVVAANYQSNPLCSKPWDIQGFFYI